MVLGKLPVPRRSANLNYSRAREFVNVLLCLLVFRMGCSI